MTASQPRGPVEPPSGSDGFAAESPRTAESARLLSRVGRYDIFGAIGSGGMATVHLGRLHGAAGFRRTVAIKRLHASYAASDAFASRFVDEARIASRIHHPNVVTTLDAVVCEGELLLVMEHVLGESLARLLAVRRAPMPAPVATAIAVDVLRGLHAAHEATDEHGRSLELVHRDVSPQNVLVGVDGVARVLDFGIATVAQSTAAVMDRDEVRGKVAYMAPEQLYAEPLDRRADVYAVGVMLWECLTGRCLFERQAGQSTATRVLELPVARPGVAVADLPDALDGVVMRALERNPAARYPDAPAMERALLAALAPGPPAAVAQHVVACCGEAIEARRRTIAAIDALGSDDSLGSNSLGSDDSPGSDDFVPDREPSSPTLEVSSRAEPPTRWLALGGLCLFVAGLGVVAWTEPERVLADPLAGEEGDLGSSAAAEATDVEPAASSHEAAAAVRHSEERLPPDELVRLDDGERPQGRALPAPRTRALPALPAASTSACDPPFTLDENGRRRYHRGCFP